MGRAVNRAGPTSARSSASSLASSSSSSFPVITSELDPAHPINLKRSLSRNDVELAALEKLHSQIRLIKGAIIKEFGEERLLECVLIEKKRSKGDGTNLNSDTIEADDNDNSGSNSNNKRLKQLTTSFFLRMKLRRKLLNRLARRLHRVAYSLDYLTTNSNNRNNVSAPLPPRYGDVVRRYLSLEAEESGGGGGGTSGGAGGGDNSKMMMALIGSNLDSVHVIREKDLMEYVKDEESKKEARELLKKQRQARRGAVGDEEGRGENANASATETTTSQEKEKGEKGNEESMEVDDRETTEEADKGEEEGVDNEEPPVDCIDDKNANSKSEVDLLLQYDADDQPYLDQLVDDEPGYDKLYTVETVMPSSSRAPTPAPLAAEDDKKDEGDKVAEIGDVHPAKVETTETEPKQVIKVTMPIVSTIDEHELNDDGLPITATTSTPKQPSQPQQQQPTRLPFTLTGATPSSRNVTNPKENAEEWKRWTTEILDKIPNQITFEELGVGGPGVVFDLEGRLASKKRKEHGGEDEDGGDEEDGAVSNQGKGKVLRRSSSRDDEVGKKSEDEEETEFDKDATMEEADATAKDDIADTEKGDESKSKSANSNDAPKSTKSFSVLPVPSFHYLDRKRICNLQYEMVKSLQVQRTRERVIKAQAQYDAAYNRSIELQQLKSATMADLNKVVKESKAEEENVSKSRDMLYGPALHHWKKRQFQLQDMEVKYGKEQALYRDVSNDVLQDMKDRVCIRVSTELSGTGLGTYRLRTEALKAESEDNIDREVSATVLGHMIDTVDRRYNDMLANHTEFVLPPQLTPDSIIVDHETGETLAQSYARKIGHLRAKITQLDSLFVEAEKKRCEKWTALNKAKGAGVAQSNSTASSSTVSKPKPRSRKSTGAIVPGGGGGAVVGSSRMSYPMQMQAQTQPGAPGYGNPSYYDPQRAAMASQQQLQARMMMRQQQQQAQAQQLAHMQNMLAQQQRQLQERAALGVTGLQFQSVPTNVVPQMRMAQYPQPHSIASTAVVPVSPSRSIPSEAVSARNQPRASGNIQPRQEQQPEGTSEEAPSQQRTTLLSKYGYGDRYSQSNVNARKKADGTVVPVSAPKLMPDGTFARPSGRQRKGMEWDAVKGIWYPLPEGQQPSSWSGDDEN